ncbi:hypothetical protein KTR66_20125 [Roseococcus sp. SDR]|uniref:class I SAM-dependent methyltransferase n=1 Tax=Roseococcus sp. SDR TaxID=2835532 RepID=UPI001BCF4063|nr:hypothetical protein [Roseococcus sp. SDR]MBS7792316.1 hypothetical protein [Roseococcus sp. SDR]MBV1847630.1 hypothetical protein [Roseococcus sp. SDR]
MSELHALQPAAAVWPDRAARFYAQALDRSDYGQAVAQALGDARPASLLDIGAGAGHPVAPWLHHDARWTAIEPSRYLRARLGRLARREQRAMSVHDATWEMLPQLGLARHDWVWAANIGATQSHPHALLRHMRALARQRVIWLVPAQPGPRRWCLSGALPAHLHGESERPGMEFVLDALGHAAAPTRILTAPWTFRARFADVAAATEHCAMQLALPPGAACRATIHDVLASHAKPLPDGGIEVAAPKLSALLIWDLA